MKEQKKKLVKLEELRVESFVTNIYNSMDVLGGSTGLMGKLPEPGSTWAGGESTETEGAHQHS